MRLVAVCGAETTPVLCYLANSVPVGPVSSPLRHAGLTASSEQPPPRQSESSSRVSGGEDGLVFRQERYGFTVVSRRLRCIGCQPLLLTCPRRQKIW